MALNMYNSQNYFNQSSIMPNGSVFLVNNINEQNNIATGFGTNAIISLNDNMLVLKNMNNGNNNILTFKLTPYTEPQKLSSNDLEKRMSNLEQQMTMLINSLNKNNKEQETIPWDT